MLFGVAIFALLLVAVVLTSTFGIIAVALLQALVLMYFVIDETRLLRRVRRANRLLCEHCLYDLSRASEATCPECGRAYEAEALNRKRRQFERYWFFVRIRG